MRKRLTHAKSLAAVTALTTLALTLLSHATTRTSFAQSTQTPTQSQTATQSQTPAQTQASSSGGGGSGGRVVETHERGTGFINGRVIGESGEPLAGVAVFVSQRGIQQGFRSQRATTDDEGNFTITGLDPGLYNVNASMTGFITDNDPATSRPAAYRPGDNALVRLVKGGVITGTVTDQQGEPVVAINVRAYRVRDADGRPLPFGFGGMSEDSTDDRGVYRMYGLTPGVYVVAATSTGRDFFMGFASAYSGNVATFYPSGTRDTASEINVRAGQENAGVDIRYRDESGRSVSGHIETPAGTQSDSIGGYYGVRLVYASSGMEAANSFVQPNAGQPSFSFEGVADGDYDLQASAGGRDGQTAYSPAQRVSVRGMDVTGLTLKLTPLSSVSGTLVIEQATEAERAREMCKQQRPSMLPQETLVTLSADRNAQAKNQPVSRLSLLREATPDSSGAFTLRSLEAGRYRLSARPFDDALYTRSVKLPTKTPSAPMSLEVSTGQQLNGVEIRLAQGAAMLSGRVVAPEVATAPPFSLMRVYLVPAERESADDLLRYFDATPDGSGAFTFKSLPPGRYLVVARPAPEPSADAPARPAYWDADSRARLRREAEAANAPVELQPCQRTNDFTLRLPK